MIQSVFKLFENNCSQLSDQVATQHKQDGEWKKTTWKQLKKKVDEVSAALVAMGVNHHDRVAILSKTRLEWVMADLGILGTASCTVPIYPSNLSNEVEYIVQNAGIRVIFAEDKAQLEKIRQFHSRTPLIQHVICFENLPKEELHPREITWDNFLRLGGKEDVKEAHRRAGQVLSSDLATIVYTSGTTGIPKGVMLTHSSMLYEATALEKVGIVSKNDVQLLLLPLAHIFAKILEIVWLQTAHLLVFAESIEKAVDNMGEVSPTLVAAVPRIYEKVQARVISGAVAKGGIKGSLAKWAFHEAAQAAKAELEGKKPSVSFLLAKKLVFSQIKTQLMKRFGGKLRVFISGGAPLSPEIAYFFQYADVLICEGYGLTETTAALTLNLPHSLRIGSVGKPLPGTEVKVAKDGELLFRGPNIFQGYWDMAHATKEVLTSDGWFHTGDIGRVDEDNFVYITDRKKDLIVTAGGKNIAPQKLENLIKNKSFLISQAIVVGDKHKYLSVLLTLDEQALLAYARKRNIPGGYQDLLKDSRIIEAVERAINRANQTLASYEQIKKFALLEKDLVVGEELTPSMKVKRAFCNKKYANIIEGFYR